MSFGNLYLFKSYALIKYMFCMENDFDNESYGDIILYFCEIGNVYEIFNFGLYDLGQLVKN